MAPHPPKFKAGDIIHNTEGHPYLFVVGIKGSSYDLFVLSGLTVLGVEKLGTRLTATAKIIDWSCELAT